MKKIISAILLVAVMACSLCVAASADGALYLSSDFSSDEAFAKDFFPEAYATDEDEAFGYGDARALQTKNAWHNYDTEFTFCAEEDDAIVTDEARTISFVYLNNNLVDQGLAEENLAMALCVDYENDEISLIKGGFSRGDTTEDLCAPIEFDFEDGEYYTFGMSVTQGRIRVFQGGEKIIDYVDTANQYFIGYEYAEEPSILLWWNTANYVRYSNIKVSTPGYLYPITDDAEVTTTPAVEENVTTTTRVTTTSQKVVDVTDKDGNTVTDAKGEKVTSVSVVTEAPFVADTNNKKPESGASATTGDATFAVIAAMVATLGCALIVRKNYAK